MTLTFRTRYSINGSQNKNCITAFYMIKAKSTIFLLLLILFTQRKVCSLQLNMSEKMSSESRNFYSFATG